MRSEERDFTPDQRTKRWHAPRETCVPIRHAVPGTDTMRNDAINQAGHFGMLNDI